MIANNRSHNGGMSNSDPIEDAVSKVGLACLARELKLSHQAIRKWQRARRMPRTEWTGETKYSSLIEQLTGGAVTRAMLLAPWPELVGTEGAPAVPQEVRDAA